MKKIISLLLLLSLALTFSACGKAEPSIVGTWQGKDGDNALIYVFREDGTGTATAGNATADFTYALEDKSLTVTLGGNTDTASVEITKDTLSITDEYGTTVLTRAD